MIKTPMTDHRAYVSYQRTLAGMALTGPVVVQADFARGLERDLSDALATLRSAQVHLEDGACLCDYSREGGGTCRRCDLLDDVKTTIANCGP